MRTHSSATPTYPEVHVVHHIVESKYVLEHSAPFGKETVENICREASVLLFRQDKDPDKITL